MGPPERLERTAEALVRGCREGVEKENLDVLYAADAVSVEAYAPGEGSSREAHGVDAIRAKHDWWESQFEELESEATRPFLHGEDRFSVVFRGRVRDRRTKEVSELIETATYHVDAEGRIVREEFFSAP